MKVVVHLDGSQEKIQDAEAQHFLKRGWKGDKKLLPPK